MNWSKTKTILIIVLLLMNVFLVYNIYFKDDIYENEKIEFNQLKRVLKDRDIDISQISMAEYSDLNMYSIKYQENDISTITEFVNNHFEVTNRDDVLNVFYSLKNNPEANLEDITKIAIDILKLDESNSRLIYNVEKGGKTHIKYNQLVDGHIFDDGFLNVEYLPEHYILFEYQWLDVSKQEEIMEGNIYPFEKSILSLIDYRRKDEVVEIIDYEIVYSISNEENPVFEDITQIEPSLYWRAVTSDGEIILLNGLR